MTNWQSILIFILLIINICLFFRSFSQCKKGNSFSLTYGLTFLGMFVWGDVLVLSLFWIIVSVTTLFFQNWLVFLLLVSSFWLVRSIGETIYWFLQQFAVVKRDSPESLVGYRFVKNESIWFMYQVMWQCVTVLTLVTTIYITHLWLKTI